MRPAARHGGTVDVGERFGVWDGTVPATAKRSKPVIWDSSTASQLAAPASTVRALTIRRRLVVRGRVQGVWYRDSCQREARRLGVSGWVQNREDGSVEVVIEGVPDAVAALEAWCHVGPPSALVTGVEARAESVEGLVSFRAR